MGLALCVSVILKGGLYQRIENVDVITLCRNIKRHTYTHIILTLHQFMAPYNLTSKLIISSQYKFELRQLITSSSYVVWFAILKFLLRNEKIPSPKKVSMPHVSFLFDIWGNDTLYTVQINPYGWMIQKSKSRNNLLCFYCNKTFLYSYVSA